MFAGTALGDINTALDPLAGRAAEGLCESEQRALLNKRRLFEQNRVVDPAGREELPSDIQ